MAASSLLHCFPSSSPSHLSQDIASLNALSSSQLRSLCDFVKSALRGRSVTALEEALSSFAAEHSMQYRPLHHMLTALLTLLRAALQQRVAFDYVMQDLVTLRISDEACAVLRTAMGADYEMLINDLHGSPHQLMEVEWKFGVTAASSEVNVLGQTFVQMRWTVRGNGQQHQPDSQVMEMSLPQYYHVLHELQRAAKKADSLMNS